jgi:predicted DNA-binding transcriptional regulator AlpA
MLDRIIKRDALAERLGVSTKKLTTLVREDGLPQPIKIGSISGWIAEEVQEWIDSKKAERDRLNSKLAAKRDSSIQADQHGVDGGQQ